MCPEINLSVDTCVTVRGTCPVDYVMCGKFVEFHFGGARDGFHFAFDATALQTLAKLSSEAIARLDAVDDVATDQTAVPDSNADRLVRAGVGG